MAGLHKFFKVATRAGLATTLLALWKLIKHPETPRPAKLVAVLVLAYAVSPIDLIPDFIPVLGLLDELVLVPLGVALAVRLTPQHLWQARLAEAERHAERLPKLVWGAALVVLVWALLLVLLGWWLWPTGAAA